MSLAIDIFYDELSELLERPLFIPENLDEMEKEVTENTHGIAVNLGIINDVHADDLMHFADKLKEAAKTAMAATTVEALRFYLWHEEGQLWYSFVKAEHLRMPFSEEFEVAAEEEEVVESYLTSLRQENVTAKMFINIISKH